MNFKDARILAETQFRDGPPTARGILARALLEFVGRAEVAEGRVVKLEVAQRPRTMSDAPKDGTEILVTDGHFHLVNWSAGRWGGEAGGCDEPDGWWPLPDQRKEVES